MRKKVEEALENSGLPASEHNEIAILGAMLQGEDAVNDALELLQPDDFFLETHRRIFIAMSEMAEAGISVDHLTVMDQLIKKKELSTIGGPAYLAYLTEGIPRNLNLQSYIRIVKEKSILRRIISLSDLASTRAIDDSENPSDILGDIEEQILELSTETTSRGFATIGDAIKEAGGIEGFVSQMCDPAEMTGLSTGFDEFDAMTGGLQQSELIIIAARPSMGKTAWAINIATNCAVRDGKVVAVFSLEMSKESLYRRMVASEAGVSPRRALAGFVSGEEKRRMASALINLGDKSLHIDDTPNITTMQMRSKCRRLQQREGRLDLIVVDYLQLMAALRKYNDRQQEVASVSRGLKALAKELQVPVVALAQVSRASEQRGGDKRPTLSDLRESGQIEADADVVAFIHREEYYHPDDDEVRGLAEVIIANQRNGPTGTRRMAYNSDITRFDNLARL